MWAAVTAQPVAQMVLDGVGAVEHLARALSERRA